MIRQSYTAEEQDGMGRYLTLRESPRPNRIVIEVMNGGADGNTRQTQSLEISRKDWEDLCSKTSTYGNFRWVPPPPPDPIERAAPLITEGLAAAASTPLDGEDDV